MPSLEDGLLYNKVIIFKGRLINPKYVSKNNYLLVIQCGKFVGLVTASDINLRESDNICVKTSATQKTSPCSFEWYVI